ncbi:MAG: halocarboxylic acid dehydrogenase DehI family protein [Chloroflexi bacterium]|nr:halocarboxylic acid dehydrogenase DehI family protein [Chloroflexota bacterium]
MFELNLIGDEEADDMTAGIYGDIRETLRIPWTPTIFQALASYPNYLSLAWRTIKPAVGTDEFRSDGFGIREAAEVDVQAKHKPLRTLADTAAVGLDDDDLDHIRDAIHVFKYGNPKLAIIANALYRSFQGATVGSGDRSNPAELTNEERYIREVPLEIIEENEAGEDVRGIYDDIKTALDMPIVNTDYKALAQWPGFLELAWHDLKEAMKEEWYEMVVDGVWKLSSQLANDLTVPITLDRNSVMAAGVSEDDLDALENVIDLFASGLPGLIVNISHFSNTIDDIIESDMGYRAA